VCVFSKRIKIKSLVCRNLGVLYCLCGGSLGRSGFAVERLSVCGVPRKKRFCSRTPICVWGL
jgi:hypothetical protein